MLRSGLEKFWNAIRKLKQTKSKNPSKHDDINPKDFENTLLTI